MDTRNDARGFTLVEVLVVVTAVTILAVLAGVAYHRYASTMRVAEAMNILKNIDQGEASYFAESGNYADISTTPLSTYPLDTTQLGDSKTAWGASCTACLTSNAWEKIAIAPDSGVMFGYSVVATSLTGSQTPAQRMGSIGGSEIINGVTITYPTTNANWYSARAIGNMDGNWDYSGTSGECLLTHQVMQGVSCSSATTQCYSDVVVACD